MKGRKQTRLTEHMRYLTLYCFLPLPVMCNVKPSNEEQTTNAVFHNMIKRFFLCYNGIALRRAVKAIMSLQMRHCNIVCIYIFASAEDHTPCADKIHFREPNRSHDSLQFAESTFLILFFLRFVYVYIFTVYLVEINTVVHLYIKLHFYFRCIDCQMLICLLITRT